MGIDGVGSAVPRRLECDDAPCTAAALDRARTSSATTRDEADTDDGDANQPPRSRRANNAEKSTPCRVAVQAQYRRGHYSSRPRFLQVGNTGALRGEARPFRPPCGAPIRAAAERRHFGGFAWRARCPICGADGSLGPVPQHARFARESRDPRRQSQVPTPILSPTNAASGVAAARGARRRGVRCRAAVRTPIRDGRCQNGGRAPAGRCGRRGSGPAALTSRAAA